MFIEKTELYPALHLSKDPRGVTSKLSLLLNIEFYIEVACRIGGVGRRMDNQWIIG